MPGVEQRLKAKVGPAPVYVWVIVAVVGYFVYSHFRTTTHSAASTLTPNSVDTSTSGSGGGGAAPASGQGSAIDNMSSDLLSTLANNPAQINSNLTTALENSTNAIAGLGSEALSQSGQLQQAIITSYTPTPTNTVNYYYSPTPGAPVMPASPPDNGTVYNRISPSGWQPSGPVTTPYTAGEASVDVFPPAPKAPSFGSSKAVPQ